MRNQEEQSLKEARRAEKRAAEEIGQSAKDQARRKALSSREKMTEETNKARKLKAKKNP